MYKVDKEKLEYLNSMIEDANQTQLIFALGKTEELIKNYTNVNKLPKSIFFTHIEMALLYYQYNMEILKPNGSVGEQDTLGSVKSIQEGDTTVSMGNASDMETSADRAKHKRIFEDKLLHDFRVPLHRIRKMRW